MDVLIIHNYIWSHYKGIVFSNLYSLCKDDNISFKVFHLAESETIRKNISNIDLNIHNYPYQILFPNRLLDSISFLPKFYKLISLFLHDKPKVLNVPGYNDTSIVLLMVIARLLSVKVIMSVDSTKYDSKRTWYKEFVKKVILIVPNSFLCYGTRQKEYLESLGVSKHKINFRCQATDNDKIISDCEKIRSNGESNKIKTTKSLLYVGRIQDNEKNLFRLIDAFSKVGLNNSWVLNIVGDGPDVYKLKEKIINKKNIFFLGPHDRNQTTHQYAVSDAFILPSLSEPWGLVVNEAMLCKLPILVSQNCGCVPHLVKDGINGYIFDPLNLESICTAIYKITTESNINLEKMGQASFDIIKSYTPLRSASEMLKLFKTYLN